MGLLEGVQSKRENSKLINQPSQSHTNTLHRKTVLCTYMWGTCHSCITVFITVFIDLPPLLLSCTYTGTCCNQDLQVSNVTQLR